VSAGVGWVNDERGTFMWDPGVEKVDCNRLGKVGIKVGRSWGFRRHLYG
jgi:hypothetical protein